MAGLALPACATAPRADDETKAYLKALVERQAALERKVDSLETRLTALSGRRAARAAPADASPEAPSRYALPANLSTVKLGPPEKKAPPVPTAVELKEPAVEFSDEDAEEPAPSANPAELDAGMNAIRTGDVENGARMLEAYADKNKASPDAATALFTAGTGMQNYGDPQMASLYFSRVAADYPLAAEAPSALVRLAQCQLKLKRQSAARDALAQVVMRYPKSDAAKTAASELRSLEQAQGGAGQ